MESKSQQGKAKNDRRLCQGLLFLVLLWSWGPQAKSKNTRWASVLTLRDTFVVQGFIRDSQPGASGGLEFHEIKANILTAALFFILLDRVLLPSQVALSLMIDSLPQRAG